MHELQNDILTLLFYYYLASPLCQNANWWSSFSAAGWSKCPKQSPYIKGLYRKTVSQASDDSIDLLKDANCCNNGTLGAECVQTNWNMSINRYIIMQRALIFLGEGKVTNHVFILIDPINLKKTFFGRMRIYESPNPIIHSSHASVI